MRVVLITIFLALISMSASAQLTAVYVIAENDTSVPNVNHPACFAMPKYGIEGITQLGRLSAMMVVDVFIVRAEVTPEQVDTLNSCGRVVIVGSDLSVTLTPPQVNRARNFLEDHYLPGHWVDRDSTWRAVLRTSAAMGIFARRFNVRNGKGNLRKALDQLPSAEALVQMQETAISLGYDISDWPAAVSLRELYMYLGSKWTQNIAILEIL